jgi:hypothetical protein
VRSAECGVEAVGGLGRDVQDEARVARDLSQMRMLVLEMIAEINWCFNSGRGSNSSEEFVFFNVWKLWSLTSGFVAGDGES